MNKYWIISTRDFVHNFASSTVSLLRLLLHSRKRFKNPIDNHGFDSCIIFGNGPSLTASLTELTHATENKLRICVNNFPETDFYEATKPQILVVCAPELWEKNVDSMYVQWRTSLLQSIAKKTNWPLTILVPFEAKRFDHWRTSLDVNENLTIAYFNNTPIEGWEWFRHLLFKLNLGMPRPHNVLIPSIFLAINAGLKSIYILGADHSWLPEISVDDSNNVLVNQKHFYDHKISVGETMKNRGSGQRKLWEVLHKFMLSFKAYFELASYAETKKIKIFNATPKSYIDAFERVNLQNKKK